MAALVRREIIRLLVAALCIAQVSVASPPPARLLTPEEGQVIASLPAVRRGLNQSYALEVKPSRRVSATYTYTVKVPHLVARDWELFFPSPPDLPGQTVLRVSATPRATVIEDLTPLRRKLLRVSVPADTEELQKGVELEVSLDVALAARRLVPRGQAEAAPAIADLTEAERALALRPGITFDYTSKPIGEWLDKRRLRRAADEGEVDFARRVFQDMARTFEYEYKGPQNRTASYVCKAGKSDCCGLAVLLVSALRSQGIPARLLGGRWAASAKPGERLGSVAYFKEHVKAEFFAQGVGWVPVDVSSAVTYDKSPEKLKYFGADPGNFVVLHVDLDFNFETLHFGQKTSFGLQKPTYCVIGYGTAYGAVIREDWKVR